MGFEKVVLDKVERVLGESRKACFYNGTLFVECNETDAHGVLRVLKDYSGDDRVVMNGPVDNEYIYDFV
jgi:hypothetical protein